MKVEGNNVPESSGEANRHVTEAVDEYNEILDKITSDIKLHHVVKGIKVTYGEISKLLFQEHTEDEFRKCKEILKNVALMKKTREDLMSLEFIGDFNVDYSKAKALEDNLKRVLNFLKPLDKTAA